MTLIKKRILAIDYGTKRIGLAKSDPLHLFAEPIGTFDESALYAHIQSISEQDGIEKILVGLSYQQRWLAEPYDRRW